MWKMTIPFTEDHFDQWRASEVKAAIMFKSGKPVWVFHTKKQFQRYMELNSKRQEWEERRNANQEAIRP